VDITVLNTFNIDKLEVEEFTKEYTKFILEWCKDAIMPNPWNQEHGAMHNFRGWECFKAIQMCEFEEKDIVLDAGALHTYFPIFISMMVRTLYATDNFYWATREYNKEYNLFTPEEWMRFVTGYSRGNLVAEQADMMNFTYGDDTFDKIMTISVIEHVLDDKKAMQEMIRVLKPGGILTVTTEYNPNKGKPYDEGDYMRIYDLESLTELIESPTRGKLIGPVEMEEGLSTNEVRATIAFKMTKT